MRRQERRAHLRYRDPDGGILDLRVKDADSWSPLVALMVNESHSGLACVYVGPPLEPGREILWQEADEIHTACQVMRCQPLYPGVHLLALQITGGAE